jgi:sec-independent protein translocase protein TatA
MFAFDKPLTWIIILVIVLLIFGAGKLPDIGRSLGRSIKEFKDETQNGLEADKGDKVVTPSNTTSTIATPVASGSINAASAAPAPTIRRRIIKHPDGSEEIIEEPIS